MAHSFPFLQVEGQFNLTGDGVSRSNVPNSIYRIHDKIAPGSNAEMAIWAVQNGLIDGDGPPG